MSRSLRELLTGFLCLKNGGHFAHQVPEPEEEFVTPLRERLGLDQTQKGQSVLMIREAVRADHGDFTIHVENTHGVASASCIVNVLGKRSDFILPLFCHFSNFLCSRF